MNAYDKHHPVSAPEEDRDDRLSLYSLRRFGLTRGVPHAELTYGIVFYTTVHCSHRYLHAESSKQTCQFSEDAG